MTALPNIPRLYTALAECMAILLYAWPLPRRFGKRPTIVLTGGWAVALKTFEEKLAACPFARCNSGYLVNLAQVRGVQQGVVEVGPYELQVSRPKRKSFLAALADHIGGEGV